jgi:hypothetical protein
MHQRTLMRRVARRKCSANPDYSDLLTNYSALL